MPRQKFCTTNICCTRLVYLQYKGYTECFKDISVRISNEEIIFCKTQLIDKALNSGILYDPAKI
ncbi:hypothetical protein T4D_10469 [Trichinella pseudospiralis]|uniref:Uncharacterized protein n=1 Tax=Trichinella pseudospiralis TaxID=6337 RepID=A0A0V1FSQ7_TRIPS|nr:hypothetical protein T4D_10469 [Trichinella pseudospiralis]